MDNQKKITIRLPASHPVFRYPARQRSAILREWIETGRQNTELKEEIAKLREEIRSLVAGGNIACGQKRLPAKEKEEEFKKKMETFLEFFE